MIAVRLMGGLGNQMFQYAAGRRLAAMHRLPLTLDLSWFAAIPEGDAPRSFELGSFAIEAAPLSAAPRGRFWKRSPRPVVERTPFRFDEEILRTKPPALLVGFWQHPEYARPIREELLRELSLRMGFSSSASRLAARIEAEPSIGLHVRRGDYVSKQDTAAFHGSCSIEYYTAALEELRGRVEAARVFVFSDDPAWCRENLEVGVEFEVVEGNPGCEDVHLMARCAHQVLANSSFSWWGAWLCTNPGQVVVAPRRWVAAPELAETSPARPGWILL